MKLKIISGLLCLLLVLGLSTIVAAVEGEFIDPKIPDSWYEAPKLASDLGITEFHQSPMLEEKVASGELPPVEERLPKDPPVIEPYNQTGKYGGTINLYADSFGAANSLLSHAPNYHSGARPTPDGNEAIPFYYEGWEFSNNKKDVTIHLREGVKWSDGDPLTADDWLFWWEYFIDNEELHPVSYEEVPLLDVTSDDPYRVTLHYQDPYPTIARFHLVYRTTAADPLLPEHFMKQFHRDIVGEEKIEKLVEESEQDSWREFFIYKGLQMRTQADPAEEEITPTTRPWIPVKRTENTMTFERNPYYPFVDTEGNQLPYIDRIRLNIASSMEMITTKAVTGDADIEWLNLEVDDLPLLKKNEAKEDYRTLIYTEPLSSKVAVMFNLNHKDPKMRALFQDVRFRRAISLAINRETIKEDYYFGFGEAAQTTVPPFSKYYKEEYANSYAEYNPEKAKEILDEIGMVDRNGDGFREMPEGITMKTMKGKEVDQDGGKFEAIFLTQPSWPMPIIEMIRDDLQEIGVNIRIQEASGSLYSERTRASEFDVRSFHIDNTTINFGAMASLNKTYAPIGTCSPWNSWAAWHTTKGESGEEPPAEMKELIELSKKAGFAPEEEVREEAIMKLLEAQAENLWSIGTVSMPPHPIVVRNRVRNVPEKGLYDWGMGKFGIAHPIQFYIEE